MLEKFSLKDSHKLSVNQYSNQKKIEIIIISILSILTAIYLVSNYNVTYLSNDAAQYISTARNLLEGNGLKTDLLYYEQQLVGEVPGPQTIWPPGYPAILAGLLYLNIDFAYAPFWAALSFHLAGFFLLYKILKELSIPSFYCVAGVIVWQVSILPYLYVLMGLSEAVYIFFSLLALYFFFKGFSEGRHDALFLFLSGLCSAMVFSIRYAGIALIAAFICYLFMMLVIKRQRHCVKNLFTYGVIPFLTVFFVFGRNFVLTGSVTGGPSIKQSFTVFEFIRSVWWTAKNLTGFYGDSVLFRVGITIFIVSFVIWFLMVLFSGRSLGGTATMRREHCPQNGPQKLEENAVYFLAPILLYIFFSIGMIGFYALSNNPSFFSDRFLIPLVPVIIIALLFASFKTFINAKGYFKSLALFFLIVLGASYISGQLLHAEKIHKNMDQVISHNAVYSALFEKVENERTLLSYLRSSCCENCTILSVNGQFFGMMLDRPVIGLAGNTYTHEIWTEKAVMALVKNYKVKYLCLFYDNDKSLTAAIGNHPFIEDLFENHVPEWLNVIKENSKFLLFRVDRNFSECSQITTKTQNTSDVHICKNT